MKCAVELETGVEDVRNVDVGVLEGGVELGGGGMELAAIVCIVLGTATGCIVLGAALDALAPLSPLLYGGRRGKAAKENLGAPASQHAVPPDSSGRLVSQQ